MLARSSAVLAFLFACICAYWVYLDPKWESLTALGAALVAFVAALVVLRPAKSEGPQRIGVIAKKVVLSGNSSIANQDVAIKAGDSAELKDNSRIR